MPTPVVIITGAASGLGLELATQMCERGSNVVAVARRSSEEPRWMKLCSEGRVVHVAGDVSARQTAKKAFETAHAAGQLTTVINCAGQGVFGPAGTYSREDVDEAFRGNLIGTIIFSDLAFSEFRQSGGTIVNVMSTAAHVGRANETVYCASKWGARGYTEALRVEAKGTPVRIVAVYPGGMNTRFWSEARGPQTDPTNFMKPSDVAAYILGSLEGRGNSYVSDIVINRS